MAQYEEHWEWSLRASWIFILSLSAGLLGWAMLMMTQVKDVPREWDFGNLEFTPAASVYSTHVPSSNPDDLEKTILNKKGPAEFTKSGKMPENKMIEPLPEGIPMEDLNGNEIDTTKNQQK